MKIGLSLLAWLMIAGCQTQQAKPFPNASTVQRLDGSTISANEIDATMNRLVRDAKVTGVAIGILNDDKIVYLQAFGKRDAKTALNVDTIMSGASFTKVVFTYLVMQLVEDGTLDLDKPIYQYLPKDLPKYDRYKDLDGDERYKKITARMLLDHTSGFANWRQFEDDRKLHIHFEPGSRFAYSGEGIALLQVVVEELTHKGLGELMEARVFRPLEMTRSSMTWSFRFEANHAEGFDEQEKAHGPQRRLRADGAGSLLTTPKDFCKFMEAILQSRGLKPKTRDLMLSPQIAINSKREFPTLSPDTTDENRSLQLSYGLGWGLYSTPYGKAFFKEGHDDGWRNYTVCFPEKKLGMVIMTNSSNGENIYDEVLQRLQGNTFTPVEWEGFAAYRPKTP